MMNHVFPINTIFYSQNRKNKEIKAEIQYEEGQARFRKHPALVWSAVLFFAPVLSIAAVAAITASLTLPFACLFGWM